MEAHRIIATALMNGDMAALWHWDLAHYRRALGELRRIAEHGESHDVKRKARKAMRLLEPRIRQLEQDAR